MKKAYPILSISLLSIASLFFSCKKQEGAACELKYGGRRPGGVIIELRDSQDRDLLDPATPGHYDTTAIKTLNSIEVKVIDKNSKEYWHVGADERIRLVMYFKGVSGSLQLKLSNTITDEMTATFTYPKMGCDIVETITSFTYNGVPYTPWDKQYNHFIVKR